jgi:hypothetical protein
MSVNDSPQDTRAVAGWNEDLSFSEEDEADRDAMKGQLQELAESMAEADEQLILFMEEDDSDDCFPDVGLGWEQDTIADTSWLEEGAAAEGAAAEGAAAEGAAAEDATMQALMFAITWCLNVRLSVLGRREKTLGSGSVEEPEQGQPVVHNGIVLVFSGFLCRPNAGKDEEAAMKCLTEIFQFMQALPQKWNSKDIWERLAELCCEAIVVCCDQCYNALVADVLADGLKSSLQKIKEDSESLIDPDQKTKCELLLRNFLEVINTMTTAFIHKQTRTELDAPQKGETRNLTRFQVCPYINAHMLFSFLTDAFRALDGLCTTNGRCQCCLDEAGMGYVFFGCAPNKQSPTGGGTIGPCVLDARNYEHMTPGAKQMVKPVALYQLSRVKQVIDRNPPAPRYQKVVTLGLLYVETACVRVHKQELYQMENDGKVVKAANAFGHLQYMTRFAMMATCLLETLLQQGDSSMYARELFGALLFFGTSIVKFEQITVPLGEQKVVRLRTRLPKENKTIAGALQELLRGSYPTTAQQRQTVSQIPSRNGQSSVEWAVTLALIAQEFYRSVAVLLVPDYEHFDRRTLPVENPQTRVTTSRKRKWKGERDSDDEE